MTAYSKYRRFGLRADESLGDLPDSDIALGNVLDDLVLNTNFSAFDLKVINGLRNTNLTTNDLSELSGQQQKYTPIVISDGVVLPQQDQVVSPVPTIENVIKNRKTILGEPPMFLGGDGPTTKLIPSSAIGDFANTNYIDYTDENIVELDDFWMEGAFGFSGQVYETFNDNFGGVEWEGYFSIDAARYFAIKTNGVFDIQIENLEDIGPESYDFIPVVSNRNVHAADREFLVVDEPGGGDYTSAGTLTNIPVNAYSIGLIDNLGTSFPITVSQIFVNDIITYEGNDYRVIRVDLDTLASSAAALIDVEQIGHSQTIAVNNIGPVGTIASRPYGEDPFETQFRFDVSRKFFSDDVSDKYSTPIPLAGYKNQKVKMRVRVFWPIPSELDAEDDRENYTSKFASFDFGDNTPGIPAPYNYWYKQLPDYEGREYSYQYFLNNKLTYSNIKTNTFLQSQRQIFSRYTPKVDIAEVHSQQNLRWVAQNHFIAHSNTPVGNYTPDLWKPGDIMIYRNTSGFSNPDAGNSVVFKIYSIKFIDGFYHIWTDPNELSPQSYFNYDDNADDEGLTDNYSNLFFSIFDGNGITGLFFQQDAATLITGGVITNIEPCVDGNNATNVNSDYNLAHIKKDDLLIGDISDTNKDSSTAYRIVDLAPQSNTITGELLSVNVTAHAVDGTGYSKIQDAGQVMVVYSHRGLVDNSIDAQCTGVYGKEVKQFPKANAGTNTVAVDSIEGIQVGDVVQYAGIIPPGTLVTATGGVHTNPDGSTYHNVTLSNNFLEDLPNAYTLIFISVDYKQDYTSTGGASFFDKSFCVLPFNTAPPFLGTSFGLSTSPDYPHLDIDGDFYLNELEIDQATTTIVSDASSATGSVGILFHKSTNEDDENLWNRFYLVGNPLP